MTAQGPLDHSELRAVDACLDKGDLVEAQHRLAQLGAAPHSAAGLSYLATRLLFLRKRLDSSSVAERMQELLKDYPGFVEAGALLEQVSAELSPPSAAYDSERPSTEPKATSAFDRPTEPPPQIAVDMQAALQARAAHVAPESKLPTYRPPVWPPDGLTGLEDDHERPTAVPELTQSGSSESRQIMVDTRSQLTGASRSESPFSWPQPRARRDGRYSIGPSSIPPGPRSIPPSAPSNDAPSPLPDAFVASPRISVVPAAPGLPIVGTEGSLYARPDPRLPMAQAPEDRLLLSSNPPLASQRPTTIPPAQRPLHELLESGELWPPLEQQVARGDHAQAIAYFEENARRQLSHLPGSAPEREQELLAQLGAELLHKSWVTHHFAPFDLSLQSLERLQLAIATLYGTLPRERPASALFLLLGSYVGEVLRTTHRGSWRHGGGSPLLSSVRAGSSEWQPYDVVRGWLQSGGKRSLSAELSPTIARPGSIAWQARGQIKVIPHVLWHGDVLVESMPGLGRASGSSVWGACCSLVLGQPLDLSLESLPALDGLVQRLVDSAQPLRGDEAWLQRIALLVGAYLGEVYRSHAPAAWLDTEEPGLERFLLQLGTGLTVSPIGVVITSSVARKAGALDAWIRALMADPRRKPA